MDLRHRHALSKQRCTIQYVGLEEALGQADFVSVHVPLVREGAKAPRCPRIPVQ